MRPLVYEMDLPLGRDRVWDALTTSDGLSAWLGAHARVDPVIGGLVEVWGEEGGPLMVLRVLSIDRPRLLDFECVECEGLAGGRREESRVEVVLFPTLDGTRVRITHGGWAGTADALWLRDRFDVFWWSALEGLRAALRP